MRKILLVEDDTLLRETYQLILSTQPYATDYAENGKVALEKYKSTDYDLVLLDIMMPVMDGIEFLEHINELDKKRPEIVIMSNLSAGKSLDKARALGVHKHIVKSDISPTELISQIRYQLEA